MSAGHDDARPSLLPSPWIGHVPTRFTDKAGRLPRFQMESEDEERISRILRMQRQHREQLLHEMSPAASFQAACAGDNNNGGGAVASVAQGAPANRTQHCPHGKHHGPSGNRRPKSAVGRLSSGRQTTFVKEKWGDFSASEDERGAASLGYDPFPDLLAHSDEGPVRTSAHCKFSEASELLSSELTRSTIDPRSPLTIERVTDTPHGNERGRQRRSRKDDIMTRSVPEFRSDGSPVLHSYGKSSYGRSSPRAIPVRKVSSKRSSASITTPTDVVLPAGMSSTRSFDGSAVSSSMTASTVAAAGTSRLHHHQRSPSDGGLHRSSSFRTPTGRSPYATVATASPRKGQRSSSVSAISCPPPYSPRNIPSRVPSSRYGNVPAVQPVSQNNLNITTTINHNNNQQQQQQQQNIHNNNNNSAALLVESDPLLKQRSQAVGLEVLDRAAVKIQALWRGYRARAHMDKVHKVCQEVRLRRLEECVLDIQSKLTTVNKALLKQQKELEEERKYRTSNNEALNKLLTNMEQLEGHITNMFHQQLVQQQQLSLREKATFKPICDEPQTTESSSSSSSEVTVGNGASTSSSAPKAPLQCAAAPKEEQCALPLASQARPECQNGAGFNLSPEQTSLDGTSADDTTCTSMSEGEVRSAEVGPDEICSGKARPSEAHSGVEDAARADRGTTLQAELGAEENAESACLLALNNRLARLEAVIMKLAVPDPSLLLGSAFTNP